MLMITHLTCEGRANPLGIDAAAPRLSWILESQERAQAQRAYQILVASSPDKLMSGQANMWDSDKVSSSDTFGIRYQGKTLASRDLYYWKVIVWDSHEKRTESKTAFWQMGLLEMSEWRGQWIGGRAARDTEVDGLTLPHCPVLRRQFSLADAPERATLTVTARGLYEISLNGKRAGDAVFAPGWTDYHRRIAYQTYDVTSLLQKGENLIEALLGDGWYSGYVGFGGQREQYGAQPELLGQIDLRFNDGSSQTIATDQTWQTATSAIDYSDLLHGERFDARKSPSDWQIVATAGISTDILLEAQADPLVRITQELPAQSVSEPAPKTYIFDMGQNMVGWARLRVQAAAGTEIKLRFAEMLNPDGSLYTDNLRSARQTDVYVCHGNGIETWQPHFTFHGFRYVELTGLSEKPGLETLTGCVITSDTPRVGAFSCSHPMVNQLQSNILWGQRGNFLSIPTDCPQRDERLGWMGDAQIFVRTAACNCDVSQFFEKWMVDVTDAQTPEGAFPDIAPRRGIPGDWDKTTGAPAWGDAGVIVPWTIYCVYGDIEILKRNYPFMKKWIDFIHRGNPDLIWKEGVGANYGDWLSIDADTPKDLLATAYFAYDVSLMAKTARVLGQSSDEAHYRDLHAHIKAAFIAAYVAPDGRVHGDTQTAYLLALHFDLLPQELRKPAAAFLVEDILAKGYHLSTGFVGVGYLCPTLTAMGYHDIACRLLLNDTFPSWGYSIRHGATTIWERWNGWTAENGFFDPGMNSFNHYSLGSVGEWLYRVVAGIDTSPDHPGFTQILIQPHPGPGLTAAKADYLSVRGRIISDWQQDGVNLVLKTTIPANTTAIVKIPAPASARVTESDAPLDGAPGVTPLYRDDATLTCKVGSGSYRFQVWG